MSSESDARHVATKATDLDRRTTWRSERGDRQWIAIDLGSMSTANRVVLRWGALCARKFSVQTSPEGGLTIVDDVRYLAALRGQRLYRTPIGGEPQTF